MQLLKRVLLFKITVTVFAWVLPFLFFPKDWIQLFLGFSPEPLFPIRLLGWSCLALVVGYAFGYVQASKGVAPWGVVLMGLVSNGGAAFIVGWNLLFGEASDLTGIPLLLIWGSFAALLAITLGLFHATMQLKASRK